MWKYTPPGGWYFVSLPTNLSKEIRESLKWQEQGWGRMKASAQTGELVWETSIWYDTKMDTYILPIKSEIRDKCKLTLDRKFEVIIWL